MLARREPRRRLRRQRRCCSTSASRSAPGEVVTLLGRNGMGKTTTIRAIMGLLPSAGGASGGRIAFDGADV